MWCGVCMAYRYSLWYTMFIGIVHYWRIFLSSFCLDNSAYTAYDTLPVENSNLFIGCRASEQNTYCKSYKKAQYKYTRQSTSHGSLSLLPRSRRARFFFVCSQTVPVPVPLRFEAGLNLIFDTQNHTHRNRNGLLVHGLNDQPYRSSCRRITLGKLYA